MTISNNNLDFIHFHILNITLTNAKLLVGHPVERLKFAVQVKNSLAPYSSAKEIIKGGPSSLYAGISSTFLRENFKLTYRTFLSTKLPNVIKKNTSSIELNLFTISAITSIVSCSIDTTVATPFEVIKSQLMVSKGKSIRSIAREIFENKGVAGFYTGWTPTLYKSYPAWFSFFYSYNLSKKFIKTDELSIVQTVIAATIAAIPITFMTTPPDVIKSVMQADIITFSQGKHRFILTAVNIIRTEGIHKLWRGFGFRLVHKMMNLFVGFTVKNQYDKHIK